MRRQYGMSRSRPRFLGRVAALAATAGLLSACGGDPAEPEAETEVAGYSDELGTALAEAFEVELEVQEVVNRLLIDCMAEAGFEVHPFYLSAPPQSWETEFNAYPTVGSAPPGVRDLPVTVEVATEVGLDLGVNYGPDKPFDNNVGPNDHLDVYWSEMTKQYRTEYEIALYGQTDEERYSPDASDEPLPGCESTVYESVGFVKEDVARPVVLDGMSIGSDAYETEEVLMAWDDWTVCVADRGHAEIEYRNGSLDLWNYAALFYDNMSGAVNPDGQTFDAPVGAPWPYDEALEKEIAFAVDVAECADEGRLRDIAQTSWDEVMRSFAVDHEADIFAWHDVLKDALAGAQAVLSE